MKPTHWSTPENVVRGVVVDATNTSPIEELPTAECWERIADLERALAVAPERTSVTCEIWADTGRIIWILKDKREFCRVVLSVPDLERRYFAISTNPEFEKEYERLQTQVREALLNGLNQVALSHIQRIAVRDSDDSATEECVK